MQFYMKHFACQLEFAADEKCILMLFLHIVVRTLIFFFFNLFTFSITQYFVAVMSSATHSGIGHNNSLNRLSFVQILFQPM